MNVEPPQIVGAQNSGRKLIAYNLKNGVDTLLLIVDDDNSLTQTQVRITLELNAPTVSWAKTLEAWSFCHTIQNVSVAAQMIPVPPQSGVACSALSAANDFHTGCSVDASMVIDTSTTSELVLRKPGVFGVWTDAEVMDPSFLVAFQHRSVRFIWIAD